jgi:hypothetical protein
MGLKQLKQLKEELTQKLKESLEELISGPEAAVIISDDLERIVVTLTTAKQNKESNTANMTENILIYNTKDQNNIVFQGSSKSVVYRNGAVSGFSADNGQIDLTTLYMLQQFIYNFCLQNELLELEKEEEADTAVGEEGSEE